MLNLSLETKKEFVIVLTSFLLKSLEDLGVEEDEEIIEIMSWYKDIISNDEPDEDKVDRLFERLIEYQVESNKSIEIVDFVVDESKVTIGFH